MQNGLSVDVEDWFQVGAFERTIDRADWPALECRVEGNCDAVLAMFAEAGATGTFFTLGWVAERYPALLRRIVEAGHELASPGYDHRRVFPLTADESAADLQKRSEEHTSELPSLMRTSYADCCLKKTKKQPQ